MDEREPIEPDHVWLAEEWAEVEHTRWVNMSPGEERTRLKREAFQAAYGGRLNVPPVPDFPIPKVGDRVIIRIFTDGE